MAPRNSAAAVDEASPEHPTGGLKTPDLSSPSTSFRPVAAQRRRPDRFVRRGGGVCRRREYAQGVLCGTARFWRRRSRWLKATLLGASRGAGGACAASAAYGRSVRIGITGLPGAGRARSSRRSAPGCAARAKRSPCWRSIRAAASARSILGDKTRMEQLAREPGAFIRPSPWAERSAVSPQDARVHPGLRSRGLRRHPCGDGRGGAERKSRCVRW